MPLARCTIIVRTGNFKIFKYICDNGCEWNVDTSIAAAKRGKINFLRLLHEKGCEWNEDTMAAAISEGKIKIVKFLHENRCAWDQRVRNVPNNCRECYRYVQNQMIRD